MSETKWLESVLSENEKFRNRIKSEKLPLERTPGKYAVITCMDPRVNLESIGIAGFGEDGAGHSDVRVIRTIGAMAEKRSLLIGIFLAGFREIIVLMHTDCGCSMAYSKIDTIIENMQRRLSPEKYAAFKSEIGEPFRENLMAWLKVFEDPCEALKKEIEDIKSMNIFPDDIYLHGLVYDLATAKAHVLISGYESVQ